MKTSLIIPFFIFTLLTACANKHVPKAKVTIQAFNQDGIPIVHEPVQLGFSSWGGIQGRTNQNGLFTGEGRPTSDYSFSIGYESNKYYYTSFSKQIADWKNYPADGKWKPWNETIKVVVKEKLNPIPMYASGNNFKTKIPIINEWVGYDFEYNDWVKPHGNGLVADIEICLSEEKLTDVDEIEELKIRFPYPLAGAYVMKKDLNCDFKSVYHADQNATYQQEITWYNAYKMVDEINPHAWTKEERYFKVSRMINSNLISKDDYLIFRTRTKVDENGNLIEARYGKVYGPIEFSFNPQGDIPFFRQYVNIMYYYLNPTVNDTNLEYDSKHNLLRNKVEPRERASYFLRLRP